MKPFIIISALLLTGISAFAAGVGHTPADIEGYLSALIITSLALIAMVVLLLEQRKKLAYVKKELGIRKQKFEQIAERLNDNAHIREEYIAYFVNTISGYIQKIEKLKLGVERKLALKKYDDISLSFRDINIKKEREALHTNFDHSFLRLFPDFVTEFNTLFKESDQVWPKESGMLNTDLRIFALLRLGITDCETIGSVLEYSPNTIYVYRTRIKSKAILPGDQFEQAILSIKAASPEIVKEYHRSA